jgi:streptogramin lyase
LLIEGAEGKRLRLISDGSFTAQRLAKDADWKRAEPKELDPARFSPVHIYGQMGVAPWGMMDDPDGATSDASTPAALEAQDMQLQPGWAIELLHQPDPNSQGSWVALCEAPGAVLYAADQYGAVWRASMRARPMEFARIPATIGGAHGLVWYDDALYCVVAESSSARTGLWRVDDTDGDGVPDAPRLLRAFEGGGEHGPHGVVVGPDGLLWIVGGNHTTLP